MTIAIVFHSFGPYHVARIGAVARRIGKERCLAIEIAARTTTYAGSPVETDAFRRQTLISEVEYENAPAARKVFALLRALQRFNPDAVALPGWGYPETQAALAWCRLRRKTAVVMSESQEKDNPRRRAQELVKRALLKMADAALVGGASHAAYVAKLGVPVDRIFRGYDVVDNDHFASNADRVRADAGRWRTVLKVPAAYFLTSARFVPEKNLLGMMRAYAAYRDRAGTSPWHWVLVGDGPQKDELVRARESLALQEFVHFPGFVRYPALPAYYALASAFVLPSTWEPWGLVVNEAMASGLPVLVSSRCGAAELVRPGENGYTFDPYNEGELTAAMVTLATSPKLEQMGESSRCAIRGYGVERFASALVSASEQRRGTRRRALPARG